MNTRIGFGIDIHRLSTGESLWLGGVLIPHEKGTVAHSDGDVLIHAICDALLGAARLGDIGSLFPDSGEEFKNIDSKILLARCHELLRGKSLGIVNIDSVVCMQKPKLRPYIPLMEETIAGVLGISVESVSVKATTSEKLGFEGREEGVSAYAVILVQKLEEL